MPHHARSHSENRSLVCIICFNKGKNVISISEEVHRLINNHAIYGYSLDDERLPSGICGTCRLTLMEYDKGIFKRPLKLYDHSKIAIRYQTRTQTERSKCTCVVCKISSGKSADGGTLKTKRGRPSASPKAASAIKIC